MHLGSPVTRTAHESKDTGSGTGRGRGACGRVDGRRGAEEVRVSDRADAAPRPRIGDSVTQSLSPRLLCALLCYGEHASERGLVSAEE